MSSGRDWFRHSRPPFTDAFVGGLQRQRCHPWDASANYPVAGQTLGYVDCFLTATARLQNHRPAARTANASAHRPAIVARHPPSINHREQGSGAGEWWPGQMRSTYPGHSSPRLSLVVFQRQRCSSAGTPRRTTLWAWQYVECFWTATARLHDHRPSLPCPRHEATSQRPLSLTLGECRLRLWRAIAKVDRHLAQVYALQEPLLDAKYQIALLLHQLE
jgi:hypothetical protein